MSRTALLARAQAAALAGMVDACTIRRRGPVFTSPDTGVPSPAYSTLYTGQCRVQQTRGRAQPHNVGQDYQLLQRVEVQVPLSVTGLKVTDEVTITASRDPDLVGRVFLVKELAHKTDASSRRVEVTERTAS